MIAKGYFSDLLDLVFPHCCPGCDRPFAAGEDLLCTSCEIDLPIFPKNEQVTDRFAGRINIVEARAYLKFIHAGLTQKLLHAIKYHGNTELGELLGEKFILHFKDQKAFTQVDLIIPVPLHPAKLRARGYNQSELLAKGMANALQIPVDATSVKRVRKSTTQTRKSRLQRWQNVSGIFTADRNQIENKHVLLVDDVITTGATLEACGEAILNAGATSLSVAALAAAM